MSEKLAEKIAVITGGSSGIGLATAKRFVKEGAFVFITGRRQSELDAAVKEIGHNVAGVQSDVSKPADLDRLYTTVRSRKASSTSFLRMRASANLLRLAKLQTIILTSNST